MTNPSQPSADRTPAVGAGLARLFAPRSIAIVGASDRPGSFGKRTQENLARFDGALHLVNPRRDEIDGRPCVKRLSDLDQAPDCVIVATPRDTVEAVIAECAEIGVGGALIYASGFAEVGRPELVDLQKRIVDIARDGGVRLIGPNAIGFVHFGLKAGATFLSDLELDRGYDADPAARSIGLVSQSGALGLALTQAMMTGRCFSHVYTCGNSADIDVADCVAHLAEDDTCRAIACNFEGLADPRRLRDAALKASAADKPLIVYKMATGESGAAAAASHTGSLAGAHEAYRSMLEMSGAVMVDEYETLLETADFFARAVSARRRGPTPPSDPTAGDGVAVVATSGGAAIMAADAAEAHHVPLPQPDPALKERLEARIPEFGSSANPCDVTAQVLNDMESLVDCAEGFLERDDFGAFVIPHLFAYAISLGRIPVLDDLAAKHGKLICTVWLSAWLEGPGSRELLAAPNTALFRSMDRCFATYAAWRRWLKRARLTASAPRLSDPQAADAARSALGQAQSASGVVSERAAKPILAAYGLPTVEERAAADAAAATSAAGEIGFPVAMKLDAPDLAHKTEIGGVALGLGDQAAVATAASTMIARAEALTPRPEIRGVLVQKMAPKGVEIVVGGRVDPVFGPLVVVGIGGVLVETLRDTVVAPAPVTPAQAARMLERLRHAQILDGVRDLPAVDRVALAELVARASELIDDLTSDISEIDVNPLICAGAEMVAVDALIIAKPTPDQTA